MITDTTSICQHLILEVAEYSDVDPLNLPPLYDTIDPDSLDDCVVHLSDVEVSLRYAGVDVNIGSNGEIALDGETITRIETEAIIESSN